MPVSTDDSLNDLTCWTLTTGEAGTRAQVIGLASRVGVPWCEKTICLNAPWRWLPGHLCPAVLNGISGDSLAPPWPDLLISSGRRSVAPALAIKRASGGRTLAVHLQHPRIPLYHFDLVIAPRHDRGRGANLIHTLGAVHRLTGARLAEGREQFRDRLAALPRPLVAVLIGGNSRTHKLTPAAADGVAQQLRALVEQGCGMVLTFSARTGEDNAARLRRNLDMPGVWIWDGTGDNPYVGMLGLADYVLVTCDSVSMVTEATATGKPVMTIDLPGGSAKFTRFYRALNEAGLVRPFSGRLEDWSYTPPDEAGRAAEIVRQHLQAHRETLRKLG